MKKKKGTGNGPLEWERLLLRAIQLAERRNDNRLPALRAAKTAGKAESVLRKFGVISQADLAREFPVEEK